jgi:RNA polymerase sigma-70 factor (ECF subfamily)
MDRETLQHFAPYHAVRADLLRRTGRNEAALKAYDEALSMISSHAEHQWLIRQRTLVTLALNAQSRALKWHA